MDVIPIGEVQGVVGDDVEGEEHRSPYAPADGNGAGQVVSVRGVIYQELLDPERGGGHGFFLQNTEEIGDEDPRTSDAIFVWSGESRALSSMYGMGYAPEIGDEIVVRGAVVERYGMTALEKPLVLGVLRRRLDVERVLPAFEVDPPGERGEAMRYWERREGMRARVPAGSRVIAGRDVFGESRDAEIWVTPPEGAIAQREDPFARRAFRGPHPLDQAAEGLRVVLGSLGLKATMKDRAALLGPARTFDTMSGAATGGLCYSFGKYQIEVDRQVEIATGIDPAENAPPEAPVRPREYLVVTYNLENLYDFRDDPGDDCDAALDPGCPGVRRPFDYLPASEAEYRGRLEGMAAQIVRDLHAPEIVLAQELEAQDLCVEVGEALACVPGGGGDGRPDVLQDLALAIAARGGPRYEAAFDAQGADARGISVGFLYRSDRVELVPARAWDALLGSAPRVGYPEPG
ncbi:MAG TPA: hypothetical protein VLS89_11510, partial [Candidatus Nanopelagicales bacterium]|nr:hypothetical protein [Candidatus Nanopelagicales bacterium]